MAKRRIYKIVVKKSKSSDFLEVLNSEYNNELKINNIIRNGSYYIYSLYLEKNMSKAELANLQERFL